MNRELLQQVLRAFEVATAPLAKDRMEISAAIELIKAELAKPLPEPVKRIPLSDEEIDRIDEEVSYMSFARAIENKVYEKLGIGV